MNRRDMLKLTPAAALALPFGLARLLATRQKAELPVFHRGDVLTAAQMNAIVGRINELSREAH